MKKLNKIYKLIILITPLHQPAMIMVSSFNTIMIAFRLVLEAKEKRQAYSSGIKI